MGTLTDDKAGTTTTTGTASYVISGSLSGRFAPIIGNLVNGATYDYKVQFSDPLIAGKETGRGVWTTSNNTLSRTVKTSSNNNQLVSWAAGTKTVYITADSETLADMEKMVEGATKKILTPTERTNIAASKTKTDRITVTQDVNLDQMEADIASFSAGMTYKGNWDAGTGSFPTGANIGDFYYVSVSGTAGGVSFTQGDNVVAIVDNASTSNAAHWSKHDQTDAVQSVNAKVGTVVLNTDDISDATRTNKWATAAEKTKLGYITVGQDVNLDTIESTLAATPTVSVGTTNPVGVDDVIGKVFINTSTGKIYVFTA